MEERKENEKIKKKVDAAMADIEGRKNFKEWLREKYDGPTTEPMNEQQWRLKIEAKMYTVLVDKTKAMLVSKSTKMSHSQWVNSWHPVRLATNAFVSFTVSFPTVPVHH